MTRFNTYRRDFVLIELQMPRMIGLAAIMEIRARAPKTRILVLTTYRGDMGARRAIKAGATGYVLTTIIRKELITAIREVHAGRRYIVRVVALEFSV